MSQITADVAAISPPMWRGANLMEHHRGRTLERLQALRRALLSLKIADTGVFKTTGPSDRYRKRSIQRI